MTSVLPCARVGSRRGSVALLALTTSTAMVALGALIAAPVASAAQPAVGLGTATSYSVLAGTTVTNTGPSVISGDLGVSPGSAITGFPPGLVNNGAEHAADAAALQAESDLTTAYNDAAGRTPVNTVSADLGGQTLAPGVYQASSALSLTGTVTLDAQSDPNAVFVFQAGSTLITASNSTVNLIGGAQACNVYWQVGSSATLGTGTTFVGSILALTSASVQTGATVDGRVLARNGQVSLDDNTITRPACATPTTSAATTTTTATAAAASVATTTTAPKSTTVAAKARAAKRRAAALAARRVAAAKAAAAKAATTTTTTTTPSAASGSGGSGSVIPAGHPQTGAGGASHSSDGILVAIGALGVVGAGVAMNMAIRRRRMPLAGAGPSIGELDGDE
jgi:hypothetical protein